MPVERIYIAHIKGCNINLKKYGTPSYRQVKLFPQADNYRLGVSKSYQPLSTLSPLIETGSRYIVDIFYFSHFLDCILDIALCSLVLTTTMVFHSWNGYGLSVNRSYQRTGEKRFPDFGRDGSQGRRQQEKVSLVHSSSLYNAYNCIPTQHPTITVQDLVFEGAGQARPATVIGHHHGDGDGPRPCRDISLTPGWAEMGLLGPWAGWGKAPVEAVKGQ